MFKKTIACLLAFTFVSMAGAQKRSVAVNAADCIDFLTINGEISCSISRNLSAHIRGRYSPFILNENSKNQKQNKKLEIAAGLRYWLWNVYSGWFFMCYPDYVKYNTGGIFGKKTYEGESYGALLGGGYAFMLSDKFNLEIGAESRVGYREYVIYELPKCGRLSSREKGLFAAPGSLLVQFTFVF